MTHEQFDILMEIILNEINQLAITIPNKTHFTASEERASERLEKESATLFKKMQRTLTPSRIK